jgi:hypothetical protein
MKTQKTETDKSGAGFQTLDKPGKPQRPQTPKIRWEDTYFASGKSLGEFQVKAHNPRRYAKAEGYTFYLDGGFAHLTSTGEPVTYEIRLRNGRILTKKVEIFDLTKGEKRSIFESKAIEDQPKPALEFWYLDPWQDKIELISDQDAWQQNMQEPITWAAQDEAEARAYATELARNFGNEAFKNGFLSFYGFGVEPDENSSPDEIKGYETALELRS